MTDNVDVINQSNASPGIMKTTGVPLETQENNFLIALEKFANT